MGFYVSHFAEHKVYMESFRTQTIRVVRLAYFENIRLDEVERALLENVLGSGNLNLSQLSKKLDEPKANVHRRIERLEEERILESQQIGRQRIVSINPAAVDKVRGALGIVPTARVLVLVSPQNASKLIDFFKPHEIYFLTTERNPNLDFENCTRRQNQNSYYVQGEAELLSDKHLPETPCGKRVLGKQHGQKKKTNRNAL